MTQEQFKEMFRAEMTDYLAELAQQGDAAWGEEWNAARKWAEENGIILGDENGNKQYQAWTTRQTLVLLLYRMEQRKG